MAYNNISIPLFILIQASHLASPFPRMWEVPGQGSLFFKMRHFFNLLENKLFTNMYKLNVLYEQIICEIYYNSLILSCQVLLKSKYLFFYY